jgi:DNA-directed RNA polymerase sigma subunit (sigma70/sigma32)
LGEISRQDAKMEDRTLRRKLSEVDGLHPFSRDEVSNLLEVLDDRERKIIFQRFGLDGDKPKTLEEVGKKFGVGRERIRQLQNSPWRNCVGR